MTARVTSATAVGFDGHIIDIECDANKGLPAISIVGLGNKAIDEAKERVRSAITNSHLDFPAKKMTINLAPANLPKDGSHFDVPIALAILIASGAHGPDIKLSGAANACGNCAQGGIWLSPVRF